MAVEVLSTLILKNKVLASGVTGRLMFQNRRVPQVNGYMNVNAMWEQMRHEFDWSTVPLRRADWQYMQSVHIICGGGHKGFLMEDPTDYQAVSVANDTSTSGVVAALTSTTYQLYKRYTETASTLYADRKITRPRATGFVVSVSGVPLSTGYSLDAETGILTIAAAPSAVNVTWTGRFYVPVHFQSDSVDWSMVISSQDPDARFTLSSSVIVQEVRE